MDARAIEVQLMYGSVQEMKDPKAVLEKLATLRSEMGWTKSEEIRLLTYGVWLQKNGPEGWFGFFEKSAKALQIIMLGGMPREIPEEPEGWIQPIDYFTGKVKPDGAVQGV